MTDREPQEGDQVITHDQYADIAKAESLHPTMSDIKSIPGYTEHEDGTWSAPANGAWGEAMGPHWRKGGENYSNRTGQAVEPSHAGSHVGWSRKYEHAPYWRKGE